MKFFKSLGLGFFLASVIFLFFFSQAHDWGFLSGIPVTLGVIGAAVMVIVSLIVGGILHETKTPTNNLLIGFYTS
jgi:hypothetical protein